MPECRRCGATLAPLSDRGYCSPVCRETAAVGRRDAQESIRRAAAVQLREAHERERIIVVLSGFEVDADACEEMADAIMAALAPVSLPGEQKRESA